MAVTTTTKFSSMLARRIPNRIARALIYAFLEWTLISLLLLHSLFSLFLLKFARYFGLKPPCFLCSRLDSHFLKTQNAKSSSSSSSLYSDVICEQHAAEISKLGYCSNHRKLVESPSMCRDCSPPSPSLSPPLLDVDGALCRWMRESGIDGSPAADDDAIVGDVKRCSCCDVVIINPSKIPLMPSSDRETGDFVINQRELMGSDSDPNFGYEALDNGDEEKEDEKVEEGDVVSEGEKEPLIRNGDDDGVEDDNSNTNNKEIVTNPNLCPDMLPQHLEFYIDHDDYRLIPVDMVNSVKVEKGEMSEDFELVLEGDELVAVSKNLPCIQEEEEEEEEEAQEEISPVEDLPRHQDREVEKTAAEEENKIDERSLQVPPTLEEEEGGEDRKSYEQIWETLQEEGDNEEKSLPVLQVKEMEEKKLEEDLELWQIKQEEKIEGEFLGILQGQEEIPAAETIPILEGQKVEDKAIDPIEITSSSPSEYPEQDTATHLKSDETDAERSEDAEGKILIQVEEPCTPRKQETPAIIDNVVCEVSTNSAHFPSVDEHEGKQIEDETEARNSNGTEAVITESSLNVNVGLTHNNELEEERIPDTPTSVESLHHLHKKLLLLGRRESATEESLDGSMISELEGGDGAATVEKLKSDLQAERKALRALYKELEEERNAAAIAANQTMAMITRLQEEKARMQMEALQYQRMMEEQSEYDQEALQMMNELMVKREKEKQELEKELELYRRKVIDYEEREKMRILCRRREGSMRSRNSSASCSYGGEESDGLSIDLNHEAKDQEEDTSSIPHSHDENGHQDTPTDAVLSLQDSLASFDVERHAILEQLKVLEEKLFTLAEEEEEHFVNMKPFEQFYEENGKDFEDDSYKIGSDANGGVENGFSHVNGKHHEERRINGSMQKRLLPLFDATELLESTDLDGKEDGFDSLELHKSPITKFELEKKRLAIEEEVDNVYERLQALEADREFLKHCIGSLRKGDKGLDLLQEILQHLRDLKSVELQVMKNMDHCTSV